jgi:hypothetical protein
MNNDSFNRNERIKNFQIMTDNYNDTTAAEYLMKSNWDESVYII